MVSVKTLEMAWEALQRLVCLFLGSVSLTSSPNTADPFLPQGLCAYCLPALEHSPGVRVAWCLFRPLLQYCASSGHPSKSILDVGVEEAIKFSGFDEKMFLKRGGKYVWSKADLKLDW